MSNRGWYQGDGIGLVDDKGRVSIPASLRATLTANYPRANGKDGGTVIIGAHETQRCLTAYDPGFVDLLAARAAKQEAENLRPDGGVDYNIKRSLAVGEAVPFDGSGRFIMPAFSRFDAGIGDYAFFYGVFDQIEIWDPAAILEVEGYPDVVKRRVRFYMKERGVLL